MSIQCIARVWAQAPYGGAALLTLLALADYADDDGNSYPGMETIARKARISVRGVQKIMVVLKADGWVAVEEGRGPHGTNLYALRWGVNTVRHEQSGPLSSPDPSESGSSSDPVQDSVERSDPDGSGVRRAPPFRPEQSGRRHGALETVIRRA